MIDRLHVIGPVRGASGYDRHTRELVRQLVRRGVAVQLTHLVGWSHDMPADSQPTWVDELERPVAADTVLHFTMPIHAQPVVGLRNVNYTMFEASRIPDEWAARAYEHERVVVPTEACRDAWTVAGVPREMVRVSPLGVDAGHFSRGSPPLELAAPGGRPISDHAVRFLNVAEPRPRKNLLALLRVWICATRPDDDAVLVMKSSLYDQWAMDMFVQDIQRMQASLGRSLDQAAPVLILRAILSDEEMLALYRSATHYISLSHGEGWDLAMMEAAVAGLELIAPRHTAYVEYLDDDEVEFVPVREGPFRCEGELGAEDGIFFDGLSWWDPDEDEAIAIVRGILDGRGTEKRSPARRIADEYTWERAAERLLAALD